MKNLAFHSNCVTAPYQNLGTILSLGWVKSGIPLLLHKITEKNIYLINTGENSEIVVILQA